jgi:hypothetical protein
VEIRWDLRATKGSSSAGAHEVERRGHQLRGELGDHRIATTRAPFLPIVSEQAAAPRRRPK